MTYYVVKRRDTTWARFTTVEQAEQYLRTSAAMPNAHVERIVVGWMGDPEPRHPMNIEKVVAAYLEVAIWASTDEEGDPLNDQYDIEDVSLEARALAMEDCQDFITENEALLAGLSEESIGRDFWFTRNRHGTGFWDSGLGKIGETLTENAHAYGESNMYVWSDDQLYLQ